MRAAADYGYECWTAKEACRACDLKIDERMLLVENVHIAFMAALHGTYGRVMDAEQIIKRLQVQNVS